MAVQIELDLGTEVSSHCVIGIRVSQKIIALPWSHIHLCIFNDVCETSYLNNYRTDLCQIFEVGRTMAVDERAELNFLLPQGTLPWQPIL